MNYRYNSSAWTGRAPRTTEERWPVLPIAYRSFWRRLLIAICGF